MRARGLCQCVETQRTCAACVVQVLQVETLRCGPERRWKLLGASTELPSPGEAYFSTTSKLHIVHARSISKRVKNGHATLDHRTTSEVRVCNILCVCVGACVTSCAENKRGNVSGCMCEHKPEPASHAPLILPFRRSSASSRTRLPSLDRVATSHSACGGLSLLAPSDIVRGA